MKKIILLTLAAATLGVVGCADDAMTTSVKDGRGSVIFRGSADEMIATRSEIDVTGLGVTKPASGEFKLVLAGDNLEDYPAEWTTVDEYNTQASDNLLSAGDYTATVSYGNPEEEGVNKPYYYGSADFTVVAGEQVSVTVEASIANSMALIKTTSAFEEYFHDAEFTLTTGSGTTFTCKPAEAEMQNVFVQAGTTLTVNGTAFTQKQTDGDNGVQVTFSEQTLETTKARTRHTFVFDAQNTGSATVTITLDEETEVISTVEVELNEYAPQQ